MKIKNKNSNYIIHFIGIGGIGMSGIAELMFDQGYSIQGSDIANNDNIKRLKKKGIKIFHKHNKLNITNISAAIFSSAIKKTNPEIIACKKLFIPLVSRADMLAELMRGKKAIAIAGSHGKTTTTTIVGTILENSKIDPTIINGGIINSFSKNNKLGYGKWIVVEADESDGSFLNLPHEINIITNVDDEHLDFYDNTNKILEAFGKFINNIPFYGSSIICIDYPNTRKLVSSIKTRKIITFGKSSNADIQIDDIKYQKSKTFFSLFFKKNIIPKYSGKYNISCGDQLSGTHNILNTTAAIIASLLVGVSLKKIIFALGKYKGVKRRFTLLGKINRSFIYDDYAHHPTEIKATYELANFIKVKKKLEKIIVIFQPHRFSRTSSLYKEFIKVLSKIKILYILDIYSAGEKPIKNISSKKLTKDLKKINPNVFYIKEKNINKNLSNFYIKNNLIVFMGAGSITQFAHKLITQNSDK